MRSHAALRAFEDVVERMGLDPPWWDLRGILHSTSHRYDRRFRGRFRALSRRFAESFVVGRYRAEWACDTVRDSDLQRLWRRALYKLRLRRVALREVLLTTGTDFPARATRYLQELFSHVVDHEAQIVVLNNGLEPFNPIPGLDMILGARQVAVLRDPRDVYVSGRNADRVAAADRALAASDNDGMNKSFLATDDLRQFVQRYRLYNEQLYRGDDPRVLQVRFEDLVRHYDATVQRIRNFLGLEQTAHSRAGQYFAPERSAANVGLWRRYGARAEIDYIEQQLGPYLVEQ
jgi:Sulfotransferase family